MTREELNQNDLDKAAKNLLLKMKIPGIEISTLTSAHTHTHANVYRYKTLD